MVKTPPAHRDEHRGIWQLSGIYSFWHAWDPRGHDVSRCNATVCGVNAQGLRQRHSFPPLKRRNSRGRNVRRRSSVHDPCG